MKNMDGLAITTGAAQFVQIVMIARHKNRGNDHRAKQINSVAQANSLGRKIARADYDIGFSRGIDDGLRGISVSVKVAES